MKIILICGLSGAGKTTLAEALVKELGDATHFSGDVIRRMFNDWDFSMQGRIRQACRMRALADQSVTEYVICDFIAPTKMLRDMLNPDYVVWLDTVHESMYKDTDTIFEAPENPNFRLATKNAGHWAKLIVADLKA